MTTAATTALNRIADALEQAVELLETLAVQPKDLCDEMLRSAPEVYCMRPKGHSPGAHVWSPIPQAAPHCGSIWSMDPYIFCIKDEGHPGPCQSGPMPKGEAYTWGNYKQGPEPDLGDCYCDGGGSIRHTHDDTKCTGGHTTNCFPEPEEECVDVAAARRERVSTHYYGDHCDPPHKEMP